MTNEQRQWCFDTPAWFDHVKEDEATDYENVWWDPSSKRWRPRGTTRLTLQERNQAYHAKSFAQWASHRLAEQAPSRGWEACRRAIMRLVAAWGEYGAYTALEDRILDAWYTGAYIADSELAEEARSFGYARIAEILEPVAEEHEYEQAGGTMSMHKRVHW